MVRLKIFFLSCIAIFFLGCEQNNLEKPAKMHWDRDMCDRCVMVISDRKHALQLQDPKTKKVHKFDDIGCMILWFQEEHIAFADTAKIWITDAKTGEWIDARSAFYTSGNVTPMAFGFSAYGSKESIEKNKEIFTYEEVVKKIQ